MSFARNLRNNIARSYESRCNVALFALWESGMHAWSFGEMAIAIVILAAVVALVFVALRQFGIQIPAFVVQCFWIVLCAVVVIFAIRVVLSM